MIPHRPSRFSNRPSGRRVTSGRTVSARYTKRVRNGSLLVAVVSRLSSRILAPTVGQVSDDQKNHWRQAVEYFAGDHYGVDLWYCESAGGGTKPTVTATGLGYPVLPGITGMRMTLLEYSGASGFELCDQICQADITGTSATATTTSTLSPMTSWPFRRSWATCPLQSCPMAGTRRLADTTQRCYVADNLSSGGSSLARH